jgi:hypothetical protein
MHAVCVGGDRNVDAVVNHETATTCAGHGAQTLREPEDLGAAHRTHAQLNHRPRVAARVLDHTYYALGVERLVGDDAEKRFG